MNYCSQCGALVKSDLCAKCYLNLNESGTITDHGETYDFVNVLEDYENLVRVKKSPEFEVCCAYSHCAVHYEDKGHISVRVPQDTMCVITKSGAIFLHIRTLCHVRAANEEEWRTIWLPSGSCVGFTDYTPDDWFEHDSDHIFEDALNAFCATVQGKIGQTDGGNAEVFWSGDNLMKLKVLFLEYLKSELEDVAGSS